MGKGKMSIGTIIAMIISAAVFAACVFSFARRFSGKKSCCGTSVPKLKNKKLNRPIGKLTVKIDGMRCESCRRRVTAAINSIDGAAAKVSLEKSEAVVNFGRQLTDEELISAVETVGFEVRDIVR